MECVYGMVLCCQNCSGGAPGRRSLERPPTRRADDLVNPTADPGGIEPREVRNKV